VPRSGGVVGRDRKGFTLVEVIVVLVILAILAAIAIPALTGYIDKAKDKKYIADARNAMAAVRAVISEAYAEGDITANATAAAILTSGTALHTNKKYFSVQTLSNAMTKDSNGYYKEAAKLIGTSFPKTSKEPGVWHIQFYGPNDPSSTLLNAPAFFYRFFPDGPNSGKDVAVVTYGLTFSDDDYTSSSAFFTALETSGQIDPRAGYKVLHLIYG
jgi:prepilin-type N-terminal cleavage/methylation domain-containing protein